MRLEFFILVQFVSGFMGFLLGRAVSEHERNYKRAIPDDSDVRAYVFKRDRDRGIDNTRIVPGEGSDKE